MMVQVPSRLAGLGQDDSVGADILGSVSSGSGGGDYQVLSDGTVYDPNGNVVTDFSTLPNSVTNQINALLGGGAQLPVSTLNQISQSGGSVTQSQLQQVIKGGTATGATPAQIAQIIANAANTGVKILNATQSPYLIPGTQLVYNPATGQISSGIANQLTTPFGTLTGSTSSVLMLGALAIGGLLLVGMVLKK